MKNSTWAWAIPLMTGALILPMLAIAVVSAVIMPSSALVCEDDLGADVAAMSGEWRAPMIARYTVTSEFGPRYHPVLGVQKLHTGIDLVATGDRTIVAAADGTIAEAGYNTAYGNQVVMDNGGGIQTRYAHMSAPSPVNEGQKVGAGTKLGTMGSTGYSTGPHLHFEIIKSGDAINPKPFMASQGAPLNGRPASKQAVQAAAPSSPSEPQSSQRPASPASITTKGPAGQRLVIRGEQLKLARLISKVGHQSGAGDRGVVIALMTVLQESGMRNIDYGDRDSINAFQQRPSAGWGSVAELSRPEYAVRAFFGGPEGPNRGNPPGLLDIKGWKSMDLGDAAQAVQRSGFPRAYDKWEPVARDINNALGGGELADTGPCDESETQDFATGHPAHLFDQYRRTRHAA